MFYQYRPYDSSNTQTHWGHAISTDLVHWDELPIALYPNNTENFFSGCAVMDSKNTTGLQTGSDPPMILFFTQAVGSRQQQCIASSNDRGRTFEIYAGNPVIPNDDDVAVPDFRDPKIFNWNDKWIMSLAVGNKIAFYESKNLLTWSSLSDFGAKPLQGNHDGVWECPDLLPFTVKGQKVWILLVSINPGGPNQGSVTQYFVGTFNGKQFRKSGIYKELYLDWGPDNYAGITWPDEPNNRKVLIAWMNNWDYGKFEPTDAWKGQMALPRVLDVQKVDGKFRLMSLPAVELESLRNRSQFYETTQPLWIRTSHDFTSYLDFKNSLLEIDVLFDTQLAITDSTASFRLCFYNSLAEEVCMVYSFGSNELLLDRSLSGDTSFYCGFGMIAAAARETNNKILPIKIYLDVSSIEVFADGGFTTMTGLFYPTEPLSGIKVAFKSAVAINQLKILSFTIRGLTSIYDC